MAMLEEFKRFAIKGSKIEEILLLREIRAALKK
jgi:large-conductance mechanosensitive channel